MKFKIFTEGGSKVGLGHIARCCSLYDEIASRGYEVSIYINGDISTIKFLENYRVINNNWLDEEYLSREISNQDYCIVDSYLAKKSIYSVVSDKSKIALYIDDMNRIKYPKGIVVNPSLNTDSINYKKTQDIKFLLGSEFIILRQPFLNIKRKNLNEIASRVLVIIGGSDIKNITPTIIKKICNVNININFDVVIGSGFKNVNIIEGISKSNTVLHYNLNAEDIEKLMGQSDFAITAAGQTIYELLATKTPFIPVKIADNQENNLNGLKKYNPSINYIDIEKDGWINSLNGDFKQIMEYKYRIKFNEIYDSLVDGLGASRIIDGLLRFK